MCFVLRWKSANAQRQRDIYHNIYDIYMRANISLCLCVCTRISLALKVYASIEGSFSGGGLGVDVVGLY